MIPQVISTGASSAVLIVLVYNGLHDHFISQASPVVKGWQSRVKYPLPIHGKIQVKGSHHRSTPATQLPALQRGPSPDQWRQPRSPARQRTGAAEVRHLGQPAMKPSASLSPSRPMAILSQLNYQLDSWIWHVSLTFKELLLGNSLSIIPLLKLLV